LPKGLKLRSGMANPTEANASPSPLPAVGLLRKGFLFGSSYASPTGSCFASSLSIISIENSIIPLSSSGLLGF